MERIDNETRLDNSAISVDKIADLDKEIENINISNA